MGVLGRQWHQLDRMQTICTSLQTDSHINTTISTGRMLLLTPNRVEALKACPQSTHLAYIRRRTTTGSDSSTPMRTGYFRLTHTHTAAYTTYIQIRH